MDTNADQAHGPSWHLDKRWHITQIIAMLIIAGSAITYVVQRDGHYDKRLTMVENAQMFQRERDASQDRDVATALELVRRQLDRIETKMDRAMERDFQMNNDKHSSK